MGACVSKSNAVGGAADAPESRDLKPTEEAVKGEVETADEEAERRSLGVLFKENKGEVCAEDSSIIAETKLEEIGNDQIADVSANDEKEKSPGPDVLGSKSSEDVKSSTQHVEAEPSQLKAEEEEVDEKHGMVEETGKETGTTEVEEPAALPAEKEAVEGKLAELEASKAEDKPAVELLDTAKPDDESAAAMKSEAPAVENEEQKPALEEEKKELQASDPSNVVAKENEPDELETKAAEEQRPDLDAENVQKLVVSSRDEKAEELVGIPDKQNEEVPATEKSVGYREEEKQSDNNNPESPETRMEQKVAASDAEMSKTQP